MPRQFIMDEQRYSELLRMTRTARQGVAGHPTGRIGTWEVRRLDPEKVKVDQPAGPGEVLVRPGSDAMAQVLQRTGAREVQLARTPAGGKLEYANDCRDAHAYVQTNVDISLRNSAASRSRVELLEEEASLWVGTQHSKTGYGKADQLVNESLTLEYKFDRTERWTLNDAYRAADKYGSQVRAYCDSPDTLPGCKGVIIFGLQADNADDPRRKVFEAVARNRYDVEVQWVSADEGLDGVVSSAVARIEREFPATRAPSSKHAVVSSDLSAADRHPEDSRRLRIESGTPADRVGRERAASVDDGRRSGPARGREASMEVGAAGAHSGGRGRGGEAGPTRDAARADEQPGAAERDRS